MQAQIPRQLLVKEPKLHPQRVVRVLDNLERNSLEQTLTKLPRFNQRDGF
jgi:hypothetical protein